ncbi:MAG TPA: response regulator, partial [Allocoleopsis sp.]
GYLTGAESNIHTIRRWCRQIAQHCPQLAANSDSKAARPQYWQQDALVQLVKQKRITTQQLTATVEGNLLEILFDLIQMTVRLGQQAIRVSCKPTLHLSSTPEPVLLPTEQIWQQVSQNWQQWHQAGLTNWSPNGAPVVWDTEELRRQTSLMAYHNLTTLANGNRTFRDIALQLKHPIVPLAQSLQPYFQKGIMGLIELQDLMPAAPTIPAPTVTSRSVVSRTATVPVYSEAQSTPPAPRPMQVRSSSPLVAYIEDSRFDCLAMSQILAQAGYRFINIREPIQALPILLEQKPDLVFLDLLMPFINGYEVCTQIRRISAFKETPVIIVTSSDGIVDRVRAKLVGASGFIS